jgi:alkylation response protein AidB-like acyl-CoA dehydrogenase
MCDAGAFGRQVRSSENDTDRRRTMITSIDLKPSRDTAVLDAVRGLAPRIAGRAAEIEAARQLPRDLIDDLSAAGCFRMLVPRSHDGSGFDLVSAMRVFEELSRADASVGWTVMIGASSLRDLGGLPRATFDALYASGPDVIIGGTFNPSGVAVAEGTGYRVSGRWAFASGCQHCHWLYGNCVEDNAGTPRLRTVVFSPAEIEIQDTWSVSGLCGTGSHHFVADNVLVRADRTFPTLSDEACLDEPLLRIPAPSLFALEIASVAIGIAQGALDDILALSAKKVPLLAGASLAANPLFQHQIGAADAKLRAARSLLYADGAAAWATAEERGTFAPDARARIRSAAAWVAVTAASVVDAAYHAGGGTSLYSVHPLQRRFRDIHALTQHFLVKLDTLTTAGAVLAGAEVDLTVF